LSGNGQNGAESDKRRAGSKSEGDSLSLCASVGGKSKNKKVQAAPVIQDLSCDVLGTGPDDKSKKASLKLIHAHNNKTNKHKAALSTAPADRGDPDFDRSATLHLLRQSPSGVPPLLNYPEQMTFSSYNSGYSYHYGNGNNATVNSYNNGNFSNNYDGQDGQDDEDASDQDPQDQPATIRRPEQLFAPQTYSIEFPALGRS